MLGSIAGQLVLEGEWVCKQIDSYLEFYGIRGGLTHE